MKSFSISAAFSAGWEAFAARVGFFIGFIVLLGVLSIIPQLIIQQIEIVWLAVVLNIAFQLFQYYLAVGVVRISLLAVDGSPFGISDLFTGGPLFVPYVLSSLLYGLMLLVGLVLLVVPGIMVGVIFGQYRYCVIYQGLGPVDALKASAAITKGARWKLLGFDFMLILLNLLGALPLGLGLFVTIPMSLVASAQVYRTLLSQTELP